LWASRRSSGQSFPEVSICVAALQLASALKYIQVIQFDIEFDLEFDL
jgi:hypothetical protein